MQHSMPSSVCCSGTSVGLTSLTKFQALTTKGTLIDFPLISSRKRQPIVFQFNYRLRSLSTHVLDGVLITKPITSLHGVIRMPPPVILCHVPKSCIDASLSCNCMRSCGEQLGDAPVNANRRGRWEEGVECHCHPTESSTARQSLESNG